MATGSMTTGAVSVFARSNARYDRAFYSGMSLALGLTVLAGFAPTYYLRFLSGGTPVTISGAVVTPLRHLHGVLFTAWVVLFVVQTTLIAGRRVVLHQRLGIAGAVLAAAMVAVGLRTAIAAGARGSAPPGVDSLTFMAVPFFDMIVFSTLIVAALVSRRNREAHKRLMLLAYVSIVTAAVARLPGVLPLGPLVFFGLSFLFVIAAVVYDFVTRHRVHRAYIWGGALIALSVPARLAISGTAAWHTFAEMLTR